MQIDPRDQVVLDKLAAAFNAASNVANIETELLELTWEDRPGVVLVVRGVKIGTDGAMTIVNRPGN